MSIFEAILLGVVQGLTEFLPVSSSGHLALLKLIFGIESDTGLLFDVLLHIATLIAIFLAFYKDLFAMIREGLMIIVDIICNLGLFIGNIFKENKSPYRTIIKNSYRKFDILIIISTIPTAIMGLFLEDYIELASTILVVPAVCLIITGIMLFMSDRIQNTTKTPKGTSFVDAIFVGVAQGFAILPGISRSGTTITACLACGYNRKYAVKYAFFMSIPAVLGAAILELKDVSVSSIDSSVLISYGAGMIAAAIVGFICIKGMIFLVRKQKFTIFGIYCIVVGLAAIIVNTMGLI
ncbi:MAG: undecaprenyl-diphosphate phosphatase [Lachnospiraceae bacterium]|nr:undecaprenyl-diphosphate phosphatase [Lachnospiraceae bacterium]